MAEATALECPKCGAALTPEPGATTVRCAFCGTTVEIEQKPAPGSGGEAMAELAKRIGADRAAVLAKAATDVAEQQRRGKRLATLFIGGTIVFVVAIGIITSVWTPAQFAALFTHDGTASSTTINKDTSVRWRDNNLAATAATPDGRGLLLAIAEGTGKRDNTIFASVYDTSTLKPLWRSPKLGDTSDLSETHVVVAGGKAVLTDSHGKLFVDDLTTGKTLRSKFMPDRVDELCAPDPKKPQVWALTADKAGHLVDVDTGEMKDAPRPSACPADCFPDEAWDTSHPACRHLALVPEGTGVNPVQVVLGDEIDVALGERAKGTHLDMAMGLDAKTHAVLWKRTLPDGDPFSVDIGSPPGITAGDTGAVYFALEMKNQGTKLMALDRATGRTRWLVPTPARKQRVSNGYLLQRSGRLFFAHFVECDVFDAKTGKLAGILGHHF